MQKFDALIAIQMNVKKLIWHCSFIAYSLTEKYHVPKGRGFQKFDACAIRVAS